MKTVLISRSINHFMLLSSIPCPRLACNPCRASGACLFGIRLVQIGKQQLWFGFRLVQFGNHILQQPQAKFCGDYRHVIDLSFSTFKTSLVWFQNQASRCTPSLVHIYARVYLIYCTLFTHLSPLLPSFSFLSSRTTVIVGRYSGNLHC